jgi:K+-transporting ATPase ATPase B chain
MAKNPVMLVVEVGAALTTVLLINDILHHAGGLAFEAQISAWLWFDRRFSRTSPRPWRKAAAKPRPTASAKSPRPTPPRARSDDDGKILEVSAASLRKGDVVPWSKPGDTIPGDGDVIEGVAIGGRKRHHRRSAPVIRESGGDLQRRHRRYASARRTGIMVRIDVEPGETFLDRMIAMVEGAQAPEDARTRSH